MSRGYGATFLELVAVDLVARTGDAGGARRELVELGRVFLRAPTSGAAFRGAFAAVEGAPDVPASWKAVVSDSLGYCLLAQGRVAAGLKLVHDAFDVRNVINLRA